MKRSNMLIALQLTLLTLGCVVSWGILGIPEIDFWRLVPFGVAVLILEWFEIELPRGDSSTMTAPVVANAVLLLNPWGALVAVVIPTVAVRIAMWRTRGYFESLQWVLKQTLVVILTIFLSNTVGFGEGDLPRIIRAVIISGFVVLLDFVFVQVESATRLGVPAVQLFASSGRLQGTVMAASVSAGVLGFLVYPRMGLWAIVVLVLLLLVMRQAFSTLVSVRRAYQDTIQAFVRAVEAQEGEGTGHADRVSRLAADAGRQLKYRGKDLECLIYAALLHDLGNIGAEGELSRESDVRSLSASEMIENVRFLEPVAPIFRLVESPEEAGTNADVKTIEMAYIVLAASKIDDFAHERSVTEDLYRVRALEHFINPASLENIKAAFLRVATVYGTEFSTGYDGKYLGIR